MKWGARRASPFLPERVCNLTSPSALSQPDASFLVFLRVYCKFRAQNTPVSPAHRHMDQSPPSRLGEGDPTRSLGSGELPAASGELPTAQPAAKRGQRVPAGAVLGRPRRGGVPVLA